MVIIYLFGVLLWVSRREAIRRGPPEPRARARRSSAGEPGALPASALSLGCILFGIAWAKFLVYFGTGLLVLSVGRLVLELRAERRSRVDALGAGGAAMSAVAALSPTGS